jgi:MFS family permease
MQRTAQQWLVYRLTGSPLDLGLVAAVSFAPFLLFAPFAGLLVDRVDRRRLVLWTQAGYMLLGVLQAGLTITGLIELWHVVVIAFCLGLAETLELPARLALIGRVVPAEDLLNAVALHASAFNAARIVGPAVAGLLLARYGEPVVFVANAVSYLPVLAGLGRMRLAAAETLAAAASARADLRAGLRYALNNPRVRLLTAIVTVQGLLVLPYMSLMPVFADDVLGAGVQGLGWLTAATGLGALLGAVSLLALGEVTQRGRLLVLGMFGFAAGLACFALSRSLALSLVILAGVGWSQVMHLTMSNTLVQLAVPDVLRGRVLGLYLWLHGGTLPVGSLLLGAAGQRWGTPAALLAASLAYGLLLAAIVRSHRALAQWE